MIDLPQVVPAPTDWTGMATFVTAAVAAAVVVAGEIRKFFADRRASAERLEAKVVVDATAVAVGVVTTDLKANTAITADTHSIADGRLTAALKDLADSKADTARMVAEGVARGASDLIAKAQLAGTEMLSGAQVTAKQVLEDARKEAAALLAVPVERRRPASRPRPRGRR